MKFLTEQFNLPLPPTPVDWVIAEQVALKAGAGGVVRYILKDSLKYVPLYGYFLYKHGCVFIRRRGDAQGVISKQLQRLVQQKRPVSTSSPPVAAGTHSLCHNTNPIVHLSTVKSSEPCKQKYWFSPQDCIHPCSCPILGLNDSSHPSLDLNDSSRRSLGLNDSSRRSLGLNDSSRPSLGLNDSSRPRLGLNNSSHPTLGLNDSSHPTLGLNDSSRPTLGLNNSSRPTLGLSDKSPHPTSQRL